MIEFLAAVNYITLITGYNPTHYINDGNNKDAWWQQPHTHYRSIRINGWGNKVRFYLKWNHTHGRWDDETSEQHSACLKIRNNLYGVDYR